MKDYDVIVIGSGIGGLTAAAALSKAGKSVLLLEAHDRPGGYAHGFNRKKYHFDSGVHLISGCGPRGYSGGQVIFKMIHALELEHEIEFIKINPFSHVYYPELNTPLPQTIEDFVSTISQLFPGEKEGLLRLTRLCKKIAEEISIADEIMDEVGYKQAQQLMPGLFKYRKLTLAEVAGQFIHNEALLAVFSTNWPYLGLPPSKVSFVYWSSMLIGYMEDGAYYCKGGFQQFANTLVRGIKKYGGDVRYKSPVDRIIVTKNKINGVIVNGQSIKADIVISNADIKQTINNMVGEQYFPQNYVKRLNKMQQSLSIFVVYIATDLDLEDLKIAHESFCYADINHDNNFNRTRQGDISWISITAPTLVDPSLAPAGEHLLMLTTLLPYQTVASWQQAKAGYMTTMVNIAKQYIPGLTDHIKYIEGGSPATMQRYTHNYQGAAYGWDVSPDQVGPARMQNQSPINGLFFAGHWTTPGGGIYGVSVSGVQAAQKVLGIKKQKDFWQAISSNNVRYDN